MLGYTSSPRATHQKVRKLNITRSQSPRRRFRSRLLSPHHRQTNKPGLYFYHSRFGAVAHNCKQSWSFTNQGNWFLKTWVWHILLRHNLITVHFFNRLHIPSTLFGRYRRRLLYMAFETSHWENHQYHRFRCKPWIVHRSPRMVKFPVLCTWNYEEIFGGFSRSPICPTPF